jgi:hypothetical protein
VIINEANQFLRTGILPKISVLRPGFVKNIL